MDNIKIRLVHPSYNLKELLFFNYSIQKYVDTLIIGSNGSIKAHSTILLEKNDVFKNLLISQEHKEEKVVNLPQFSIEVLKVIIEFLYRGDSRYFKEIEKEVKSAMTYFFEAPKILSDSDCVEIKPIVPVVILSDSDSDEICDSSQSDPKTVKNETDIQQTNRTKSPTRKRRILNDAEVDSTLNGYVIKKKKKTSQSKSVIQSKPSQSNLNESIVNLSPLKHLSQISVSRKKKLEEAEVMKKNLFKTSKLSEEGSNKRRVNPFASATIKPSNNLELQGPSIQEEGLKAKKNRVNIIDHTIMESHIATQSPVFQIAEHTVINDSQIFPTLTPSVHVQPGLISADNPFINIPTQLETADASNVHLQAGLISADNTFINVSKQLETADASNTNSSQEFTNMEEIVNCRNISQGLTQFEESCTATSTQMDPPSSPELEVVQNSCTSTSDVLSEEHSATEETTTSKNKRKAVPEPTKKDSPNKSESHKRNRISFNSTDEDCTSPISTSNYSPKKLKSKKRMQGDKTRSKKPIEDDTTKSEKLEKSLIDKFKQPLIFQSHICVYCMKEVDDFPKHFDKRHHSLSKTIFPCKKCSHKFFFKFFLDEHHAICTNKSQCRCVDCKP